MYRTLFIIIFSVSIWIGRSNIKSVIATTIELQKNMGTTPIIDLGPFLQLVHMGNIEIIDMRSLQDYDYAHIKNALNVNQVDIMNAESRLTNNLKKARSVVIYSSGGINDEMRQYAEILSKQGIQGVAFYSGGFREWIGAGLPVEKGPPAAAD